MDTVLKWQDTKNLNSSVHEFWWDREKKTNKNK